MSASVLIVDDSLTVRMDLADAFERAGFSCTLCTGIAGARVALLQQRFAMIVVDVVLPDGDGVELLKEIKSNTATALTPVMLLSSEAEVQDRVRGLKTGADEYVGKPYDRAYVIARARALMKEEHTHGASGAPHVLVIDDSLTFRAQLERVLESVGYRVTTAITGEEGLRLAVALRPAAIIVDGVLPGIDGPTVIRRVRADALLRSTPCILLTASEGQASELAALDAGADSYLRKEEDAQVVLARLSALLRSAGSPVSTSPTVSLLGPKRILAVDDSLTYLQAVAAQLREEGYEVVLARSGEEALELLAVQSVDCILLDMIMPGLSGQETCRRIKSSPEWRDIPLIMHTAREERDAMIEGINAGADDYITKSSELEVLRARLRAQLRRKQFEDENRNIREQLLARELEAADARAAQQLAETRARLLAELQETNLQLVRAKGELEEQNVRVQEASRLKSEFLANMSHELRTPLNAIIGFSELIHDGKVKPETPQFKQYLNHILTSGHHLLQLINDVLDLSKVEAGKLDFHPEHIDPGKVIEEVVAILRTAAANAQIHIVIDLDAEVPRVCLDPARLKQVIYNYLSNALKFTPEGGRVVVRTRAAGADYFRLEVEDTGIGIAPQDVGRLFVEFQQLDSGAGKKHSGTGLGLAFSKRLVEAQDGHVGVRSTLGKGSEFFALLPRNALHGSRREAEAEISGASPDAPLVLVIEDNARDRDALVRALTEAGYGVETAATGAQALRKCQERAFDAITLDLFLPDISGLQVLQTIRDDGLNREVPVIVVTVVTETGAVAGFAVHDVLSKPLASERLLASLKAANVAPEATLGTVLVVDDDPASLALMSATLKQLGYRGVYAADGPSGLREATATPPTAVVLDLLMPGMDGFEFLERLRQLPACRLIPVIIWTIKDLNAEERARLRHSVSGVIPKSGLANEAVLAELRAFLEEPADGR